MHRFVCILCATVLRLLLNAPAHIHSHKRMYKHRYIRTYACIHRDRQAQSHTRTYARAHTEYTSRHLRVWLLTVVVFTFVLVEQYGELYTEANARETKCGLARSQGKEESVQHGKLIGTRSQACTHSVVPPPLSPP